ncbi:hypothetical protein N7492_005903 [Penicillium capsulatum]|uniref:Uncharacterized protein n=1 Tax=Penicillium capsulatum TaxID=69766 RepID=A0A9W9IAH6_9EURO|nr:hypothetical protein N7492_005903 [Penicillium capsulatum]KAJ6134995.1 hypothetical protein N7512_000155 [Penicillium capsulatum]
MADPAIDEFAQTRGADDLFDDEIIPVSVEEQQAQTEVVAPEPEPESTPAPAPAVQEEQPFLENQPPPRGETPQRGRGGDRGRGRGRGRGKPAQGLNASRFADPAYAENTPRPKASRSKSSTNTPEPEPTSEVRDASPEKSQAGAKDQEAPEEESKGDTLNANGAESQRVPAVRGDRSATGGVRKPKLSEEELSRRIASAKENAAKKAAAHARAEADHASFLEREQVAAKKRREELANRRVMDNERERNRQRKLNAQTGREWDFEKREEDYNPRGGGSQFRRGMHGGVSGYTRRDFDEGGHDEDSGAHGSPGRGRGRGGRGSRGRGPSRGPRGERASSRDAQKTAAAKSEPPTAPAVKNETDFPSLPAGKKPGETQPQAQAPAQAPLKTSVPPTLENLESTMSPLTGTWADQVEE